MTDIRTLVIALGGHSIVKRWQRGTVREQFANARTALAPVSKLAAAGHRIVVTHGNGPQVGAILVRVEEAKDEAYELPLGVCVAESQGEMGYMIQQSLQNQLDALRAGRSAATVLTQVLVELDDPQLQQPSKPVGPALNDRQVKELEKRGGSVAEDPGRGMRRIVPSPKPVEVVELDVIGSLVDSGFLVVACGGGGMPVYRMDDGRLEGIDAVVDKDLASSVLGTGLDADDLIILTDVEKVAVNFREPTQRWLDRLTVDEARELLSEGHFPRGTMGPKVRACVDFLEWGGSRAIVTDAPHLPAAFRGDGGTIFERNMGAASGRDRR